MTIADLIEIAAAPSASFWLCVTAGSVFAACIVCYVAKRAWFTWQFMKFLKENY